MFIFYQVSKFHHALLWFCLQEVVPTSNSNTVMSLCRLFEMLLTEPVKTDPGDKNIRSWIMVKNLNNLSFEMIFYHGVDMKCHLLHFLCHSSQLQAAFAFSLVWSVGGTCDADSREKFSEFVREIVSGTLEGHPYPAAIGKWECPIDEKGLVYDYFYEVLYNCIIRICFEQVKSLNQTLSMTFYLFLLHACMCIHLCLFSQSTSGAKPP